MKTVAILGASTNRSKYGNRAVHAFGDKGYSVFPVNPRANEIEGLVSYPDIAAVPEKPDVVSVYLPPTILLEALPDIADRGCGELWLNPGTDTPEVIALAEELKLNAVIGCSLVGLVSGRL
ncbi:MAG: CoA-binding protein [Verrucomicrobiia bacterium]|jgi:predicted CoA-binding protein